MSHIDRHAEAMAASARAEGYGFAWALVIPVAKLLLPIFLRCVASKLDSSASPEQVAAAAKQRAEDAWKPEENDYSRHTLRDMRAQSQKALEDQGHIADRQSADEMSRMILDRARGVGVEDIQQTYLECPLVGEITLESA